MTRPLGEYSLADWRHLRPLMHLLQERRHRLIDANYSRRKPRLGDAGALAHMIRGRRVLIPIAYNDPQLVDWQTRLVRAFVPDALYLVADNSSDDAAAAAIATVAEREGVPYIRLPEITWKRGVVSRSHGLALNWVWRNLVRPGAPEAFGFLDHDLFPIAPDDPFAPLAHQHFYGFVRHAGTRWYLWAGFCLFRFASVRDRPLDFGQDWAKGLDTGGGNWRILYKASDLATLRRPGAEEFPFKPGATAPEAQFQRFDAWLHEVGVREDMALRIEKRQALVAILESSLSRAALFAESAQPSAATREGS